MAVSLTLSITRIIHCICIVFVDKINWYWFNLHVTWYGMAIFIDRDTNVCQSLEDHILHIQRINSLVMSQGHLWLGWTLVWATTHGPRWLTGGCPAICSDCHRNGRTFSRTQPWFSSTIATWWVPRAVSSVWTIFYSTNFTGEMLRSLSKKGYVRY